MDILEIDAKVRSIVNSVLEVGETRGPKYAWATGFLEGAVKGLVEKLSPEDQAAFFVEQEKLIKYLSELPPLS